jgi:3-oxoacyl-[acyl-carrier protein] reductase
MAVVETKKIALVTGGAGGIGAATMLALAKAGYLVVGTARNDARADLITDNMKSAGYAGFGLPFDLTQSDRISWLLDAIAERAGSHPDILVNNAGITQDNLLLRMKPEQWQSVIDTNLTGAVYLTQACIRPMLRKKFGRVINISSVVGQMGNPGQSNYAAAKAGMIAFGKSLALELAGPSRDLTVNTVAPGWVTTPMTDALTDAQKQASLERVPMKRMGRPEEIANAIVFLASDGASYITGATIPVNGGLVML